MRRGQGRICKYIVRNHTSSQKELEMKPRRVHACLVNHVMARRTESCSWSIICKYFPFLHGSYFSVKIIWSRAPLRTKRIPSTCLPVNIVLLSPFFPYQTFLESAAHSLPPSLSAAPFPGCGNLTLPWAHHTNAALVRVTNARLLDTSKDLLGAPHSILQSWLLFWNPPLLWL